MWAMESCRKGRGIRSDELSVQVVGTAAAVQQFEECLEKFHRLGSRRPKGRTLRQAILWQERWVGLVLWCGSVWHLEDRDRWIGWDSWRRVERLQLIAHQARFLVVPEAGEVPCASAILSASSRALRTQWESCFGYQPLLVETFTDPRFHRGTCYQAANWRSVGWSRAVPENSEGSAKQIWIQELHPQARARLAWVRPSARHRRGISRARIAEGPLPAPLLRSLHQHFAAARICPALRPARFLSRSAALSLLSLGLLRRETSLGALIALAQRLSSTPARALGLPVPAGAEPMIRTPSLSQLRRCLDQADRPTWLHQLQLWVDQNRPALPANLALEPTLWSDLLERWRPALTCTSHHESTLLKSPRAPLQ